MPRYVSDKELEAVAQPILEKSHSYLKMIKIAYMFREEGAVSEGKVVAGMAVKVDDRNWTLHKYDALIEIAKDVWAEASDNFRNALMDHELSHIRIRFDDQGSIVMDEKTNRIKVFLARHDIEEFEGVLTRHGAYHKDLRSFLNAFIQRKEEMKKAKKAGATTGDLSST